MTREVVVMMVDGLKFPPWLEGDGEEAIIDGVGGRNDATIAAILVMMGRRLVAVLCCAFWCVSCGRSAKILRSL